MKPTIHQRPQWRNPVRPTIRHGSPALLCFSPDFRSHPILTKPFRKSTIYDINGSHRLNCGPLLGGPSLKEWPGKKAHFKVSAVDSVQRSVVNRDDGGRRPSSVVKATVALSCVLGAIALSGMVGRRAIALPLRFGYFPFMRTQNANENDPKGCTGKANQIAVRESSDGPNLTASELEEAYASLPKLLKGERIHYSKLQEVARNLKTSDKADATVAMLQEKYDYFRGKKIKQAAHDLGLILAEMLIYQGKYDKALEILQQDPYKEAYESDISSTTSAVEPRPIVNARPEQDGATIRTMQDDKKWRNFKEVVQGIFVLDVTFWKSYHY